MFQVKQSGWEIADEKVFKNCGGSRFQHGNCCRGGKEGAKRREGIGLKLRLLYVGFEGIEKVLDGGGGLV